MLRKSLHSLFDQLRNPSSTFAQTVKGDVLIYGTGTMAQTVYKTLTQNGVFIKGFVDHRTFIQPFLCDCPIYGLESVQKAVVIIAIHNREVDIAGLINRINAYHPLRIISLIELYDNFGDMLGGRFWLTNRNFYSPFLPLIEEVDSLWADDISRSFYAAILEMRLSGNYAALPAPDLSHQYFPLDIPGWEQPLNLIDCGAYDGDTLHSFLVNGWAFKSIAAFEPDHNNFSKLVRFAASHKEDLGSVTLWPCGVSSSTTQIKFDSGKGEASSAFAGGETVIQCVALDDVLPAFNPNLIKMDIEGAEFDALLGASHLIKSCYPGLAISIYHRPEHLWQIPLLVRSIAGSHYSFYLRLHGHNSFDSILYAVPQ